MSTDGPASKRQKPADLCSRSFQFAVRITRFCLHLDTRYGVRATLARQLLRAGTSIGANIEEAQAGKSSRDFISKYAIALKEARETSYWIRLIIAAEIVEERLLRELLDESQQLAKILASAIKTARSRL